MKMEAKDIMRELPMGFGMALMKNQKAYENFCSFSSQKQDSIIEHTHQIASKKEMQAFVAQIAQNTMVWRRRQALPPLKQNAYKP